MIVSILEWWSTEDTEDTEDLPEVLKIIPQSHLIPHQGISS